MLFLRSTFNILCLISGFFVFGQESSNLEGVFGNEKEITIKTVTVADKRFITYTKDKCSLKCISVRGTKKWEVDLHKYECDLIYFDKVSKPLKGCDLLLQLKNKDVLLIKSGSGKCKRLTLAEFEKAAYH